MSKSFGKSLSKPLIGIVPYNMLRTDKCDIGANYIEYDYVDSLKKSGAEVIGLLTASEDDLYSEEMLKMCDGFLIHGGDNHKAYHLQVVDYAYKNNKPLFGVCLGMQLVGLYSSNKPFRKITDCYENALDHAPKLSGKSDVSKSVHDIFIEKESCLYKLFGEKIGLNSRHIECVTEIGEQFMITARSADGVAEMLEYKYDDKFILCVQGHPENMGCWKPAFDLFVSKVKSFM